VAGFFKERSGLMYKRKSSICVLYDITPRLFDILLKEIERCPRYPEACVVRNPGYTSVFIDAFDDYYMHRKVIKEAGYEVLPPFKMDKTKYIIAVN
jgi:hypothetical protein